MFDPKVIYTPANMLIMCMYITIMPASLFTIVFLAISFRPTSNLLGRRPAMVLILGFLLGFLFLLYSGYILNGHNSFYKMFNPKVIFNFKCMFFTSVAIMLISFVVSITLVLEHGYLNYLERTILLALMILLIYLVVHLLVYLLSFSRFILATYYLLPKA
jgi:hypothetical protein